MSARHSRAGRAKIRNEKSAQRGSFWPDVPVDIRPKTSVRPSKSWRKTSILARTCRADAHAKTSVWKTSGWFFAPYTKACHLWIGIKKTEKQQNTYLKNLLVPLFLRKGCSAGDFQDGKRPIKAFGKRPIKVGKRPIKEGKQRINANHGLFSGRRAMVENGPSKKGPLRGLWIPFVRIHSGNNSKIKFLSIYICHEIQIMSQAICLLCGSHENSRNSCVCICNKEWNPILFVSALCLLWHE